jgi:hypothetical protein
MQPGDQHRNNPGFANPFLEPQTSPYTAAEIATLQARLDQKLGPEYISAKPGPGGKKVHYLNSEKCIGLANQVFGFNGWCSSIKGMEVDFVRFAIARLLVSLMSIPYSLTKIRTGNSPSDSLSLFGSPSKTAHTMKTLGTDLSKEGSPRLKCLRKLRRRAPRMG